MFICIVLFDMRHGCIEISVLACRDRGPGSMTCGKSEKKKGKTLLCDVGILGIHFFLAIHDARYLYRAIGTQRVMWSVSYQVL